MSALFAFWSYQYSVSNGFEGVLGAEVTRMHGDGRVNVKGYTGMTFKPVRILPLKAGKDLMVKLETLQKEYIAAAKQLDKDFEAQFKDLFK